MCKRHNTCRSRSVAILAFVFAVTSTVWVNFYLGGTWTSESEHHVYIDDTVISRSPIGPLRRGPGD